MLPAVLVRRGNYAAAQRDHGCHRPGRSHRRHTLQPLSEGKAWSAVDAVQVSLKLGEQRRRRRNWWSVRSYVPNYRVKLCELGIQAKVSPCCLVADMS